MKLFIRPLGYVTSRYGNNSAYRPFTHTGVDFKNRFKGPVRAMRDGIVYKVRQGSDDLQDYRNVHQIVETPLGPMEVAYVHLWDIVAVEGVNYPAGILLGTEGNTGTSVFSGGKQVRPEEKPSGKGSHLHASVRPLERAKERIDGEHYIRDIHNRHYKDKEGSYYRILNKDNGTKGWVDWSLWMYTPTRQQVIANILKAIGFIRAKVGREIEK